MSGTKGGVGGQVFSVESRSFLYRVVIFVNDRGEFGDDASVLGELMGDLDVLRVLRLVPLGEWRDAFIKILLEFLGEDLGVDFGKGGFEV
jgi:hypothetical protein